MLTIGSLFSGYGGLDRGISQGLVALGRRSRVIWHAEKDPYARAVLAKHWPQVRCYQDVHDIDENATRPNIIGGGFPCQDLSIAGKRAGIDGARSGLWSEFVRVIRVLPPDIVLVENVPELLRYLGRVLGPLAELGFDAEWDLFDAAAVGAPHRRERLFLLAYRPGALADANGLREQQPAVSRQSVRDRAGNGGQDVTTLADADGLRREGGLAGGLAAEVAAAPRHLADPVRARRPRPQGGAHERRDRPAIGGRQAHALGDAEGDGRGAAGPDAGQGGCEAASDSAGGRWAPEPDVGRVVDGPSSRLDARRRRARLRCLGNGAVEQQVALALVTLAQRAGLNTGAA